MVRCLTTAAAKLILAVAATPTARISGAVLRDEFGAVGDELDGLALLQRDGHDLAVTCRADHDDAPVSVTWSPQDQSWGHFSPDIGWVAVPEERLIRYRLNFERRLPRIVAGLYAAKAIHCTPLIPDQLWEMGDVKLPGRGARVPLWVVRRLTDRAVWRGFTELAHKRPAPGLRIVLSLTPTDLLEKDIYRGHSIIALRDVTFVGDPLVVDPALLAACVDGSASHDDRPITISADGGVVTVRGTAYRFPGVKQRAIIRALYAAYEAGAPDCITSEVLEAAECGDTVNTLAKVFSKRTDWRAFIAEDGGRCWLFC